MGWARHDSDWDLEERQSRSKKRNGVTVGVVTSDMRSNHARRCIDLVKRYTSYQDLIILDNDHDTHFNGSLDMNKIISVAKTRYLVLMDDNILVNPGWLEGMLKCVGSSVAVVTPLHVDMRGRLTYSGVVMRPDGSGHHKPSLAILKSPTRIQTICSAVILIDLQICPHIRFDERYFKYFLGIDYGLQIWEAGFQCVCSPHSTVSRLAERKFDQEVAKYARIFERERLEFCTKWVYSGRLLKPPHPLKIPRQSTLHSL